MWKAIACDFDGTMTDERGRLSREALTAAREAEEEGVPLILSSGRPLVELKILSKVIGTSGPLISENGGIIWNPRTNNQLTLGDKKKALKAYKVFTSYAGDLNCVNPHLRETDVEVRGTWGRKFQPIIEREGLEVHLLETRTYTHITDRAVDKGRALNVTAGMLGICVHEIVAVGDSQNDVALLQAAGAGYAVGNADPRLKAVATFVTQRPWGSGCAEAIRQTLRENVG